MRLHVATPSLSRQIRQLEQVLGYELFERKTRVVAVTPAGVAFVAEARRALIHAQRAVEAGAAVSGGGTGAIRVGYTPLLCAAVLPRIREAFARSPNGMRVLFQSMYSTSQVDQILSGYLDVGLVVLPVYESELRIDPMFQSRLVAAIPEQSPLARMAVVGATEMVGQPVIWFGRRTNPHLNRHFVECRQRAGFTPDVAYEVSTVMEMLDSVTAGMGIGFEALRRNLTEGKPA